MGQQVECTARWNGKVSKGTALLETDALIFRGAFRLAIPYKTMTSVRATGGVLTVRFSGGTASLGLDARAAQWADHILHPKSRMDKLGITAGTRVGVEGVTDREFLSEVRAAGAQVTRGPAARNVSHIFIQADAQADLRRVRAAARRIAPDGAVWLVTPRASSAHSERPHVTEADALAAGRDAGLTDIKVVRFSETHTAHKFVIPRARR